MEFCQHARACGGCSWLHLSYAQQLKSKEASISRLLSSALQVALPSPPRFEPLFDPEKQPKGFRQKVAFVFGPGPGGRGLVMGHYARGSQKIVPVVECPVHSDRGNRVAFALRDQLIRAGVGAAAGSRSGGVLRHLLVRTSQDDRQAVAMLVVTRNDKILRRPVRALLELSERPDGFFINIHDGPGPFMVGPDTIRIAGNRHVRETINGLSYLVSPTTFFQTNALAAATLQRLVVADVGHSERVLDLYCGSGLFSLALAGASTRVTAVEENRQAIKDAEANARLNGIESGHVRFVCARVEDALNRPPRGTWDAVVLDPPRQGCPPQVIEAVFRRMRPARVVYVSCNLDALAAELPAILQAGYALDSVRAVDMFPHTDHLEMVARLSRR